MFRKIKDWLIKKLGGYTQREYDIATAIPYQPLKVEQHNIVKLTADIACDPRTVEKADLHVEQVQRMKDWRVHDLARQIGAFVNYESMQEPFTGEYHVRAFLRVVKKEGTDG